VTHNLDSLPVRAPASNLVSFYGWLEELGKVRATGHRWRQQFPWLNEGVINVFGRLYIKRETIAEFERRAVAGELAKDIKPDAAE
jgi:hypothetical protein